MESLQELTLLRAKINEIASTLDRVIARMRQENGTDAAPRSGGDAYESVYPLVQTPAAFFKGKKPTSITLSGNRRKIVRTWKQVAVELLKDCIQDSRRKAQILAMLEG